MGQSVPYFLISILTFFSLACFSRPIRFFIKFLLNTFLGFAALLLYNFAGASLGLSLGLNLYTSLFVGLLGPLGFLLLILLRWFFGT